MTFKAMAHQKESIAFLKKNERVFDTSDAGCVSADTEFLTPFGWKRIDKYKDELVAQFHPDTREIEFVKPISWMKKTCKQMVVIAPSRGTSQRLSPDHRVLFYRRDGSHGVMSALAFMENLHKNELYRANTRFCTTFSVKNQPGLNLTDLQIRLMVAVIADAHFPTNTCRCVIRIKKQRKIQRLTELLVANRVSYEERQCGGADPEFKVFSFVAPRHDKEFGEEWWGANQHQLEIIADEICYWDSAEDKRPSNGTRFSTLIESSADFAQYAFSAAKRPSSLTYQIRDRRKKGRGVSVEFTVHARDKDQFVGPGRADSVYLAPNREGYKYCFEVPSSFLLLRHNGYIFATGNSGKTYVQIMDFAARRKAGGKCALVLATKSLLQSAWEEDIKKFAPHLTTSVAWAVNREAAFRVDVDIYITNHDAAKWLVKQSPAFFKRFDTLIIDECFPAGTLIDTPSGKTPIEQLKPGDMVFTSSGATPVTTVFQKTSGDLYKVELENGKQIICTGNHPLATTKGWMEARATRGLSLVQLDIHKLNKPRTNLLQPLLFTQSDVDEQNGCRKENHDSKNGTKPSWAHDLEQRRALSLGNTEETEYCVKNNEAQTKNARGQWSNSAMRSVDARNATCLLGLEFFHAYWQKKRVWLSKLLQGRFRAAIQKMGNRSGWRFTRIAQKLGCEERYISSLVRVARVSRIECSSEVVVYNLQIDGPHTYSVDGILVHNCTAMKHRTSGRSKAVAKIAKHFTWRRLLSGTPMTNGVCDVWHQMFLIDDGKRLGRSFFAFRSAVCIPEQTGPQTNMVKWIDKPGAEATVSALIKDVVIRHRFEDCVDIPTNHRRAVTYHLPKSHMKRYKELEQEGLLLHKAQKITAINGAVLYGKLLQLASGAVYDEQGDYALIDTERYELTIDLVEERQHSVVFFYWQHQRDQLIKLAEARGLSYAVYDGSVTSTARRKEITDHFQAGFYRVIFAHPKSAAHGLTWTKATATIWPSATPNLEWYLQGLKRIHRIGQDEKTETIMIIAPGTIEERVYQSLNDKDAKQLTLLDYLKEAA